MRFLILCSLLLAISVSAKDRSYLDIPVTSLKGESITLGELAKTGPVYVKLWASWCQTCLKQMSHYQQVQDKYDESLHVLAVNVWLNESAEDMQRVIDKFSLTLPIAIDYSGNLAQAFSLKGTPLHVLIDQQGNIVHTGHKADAQVDEKIALLTTGRLKADIEIKAEKAGELDRDVATLIDSGKTTVLFYTASWCDWYLETSRPQMSENCITSQKLINQAVKEYPDVHWQIVLNRLWTGDNELANYREKYSIEAPMAIDKSNTLFSQMEVKDFPTLVLFKNGKEAKRINGASSLKELQSVLSI